MTLINGVDVGVTNGHGITGLPTTFTDLGTEKIAGVPFPFVVMLVIAFAVADLVNRSGPGLEMTLVGASFRASRYTGLSNARILVRTYVTCGVLSAMAGVIFAAINDSASPDYGRSYLLQAIVVAVLAGVNPDGGYATVAGVVLAATTIQMLAQGLQNWFPQQAFLPGIAQGLLLIMVMALDRIALGQRSLVLAELGRLRNRRRAAPSAPS
jgi:simple sugar transport system permease protein